MKKITFQFIFIFFTILKTRQIFLIPSLIETCPYYQSFFDKFQQAKKIMQEMDQINQIAQKSSQMAPVAKTTFPHEVLLMNIQSLFEKLLNKPQHNGKGGFGTVFLMSNFKDSKFDQGHEMAAKIQMVTNQGNSRDGKFYQRLVVNEINFNRALNKVDTLNQYFPTIGLCVNISSPFRQTYSNTNYNLDQRKAFQTNANKDVFLTFMQPMRAELFKVTNNIEKGLLELSLEIRILIALHLLKGLQVMHQVGFHCDIKPENIMFQKLTPEQSKFYVENDVKFLVINKEKNLIKYIDFGLAEMHVDKKTTYCDGGTPGYRSTDHLLKLDDEKNDIFGLGVTLLDLEFAHFGLSPLGDLLGKIYSANVKKISNFSQKVVDELNSMSLVQTFKKLMNHFKQDFLQILQKISPETVQFLEQNKPFNSNSNILSLDLASFFLGSVPIARQFLKASIELFFTKGIDALPENKKIQQLDNQIKQINNQMFSQNVSKETNEAQGYQIRYLMQKASLHKIDREASKTFGLLLNSMILPNHERFDTAAALEEIGNFYQDYDEQNGEIITNIELDETEIASEKVSKDDVITINNMPETQQTRRLFQFDTENTRRSDNMSQGSSNNLSESDFIQKILI